MTRTCLRRLGLIAAAIVVSGCVNLRPELQRGPTREDLAATRGAMYTGPVNGSIRDYYDYTDQLAAWHQARADQFHAAQALNSELAFVGAVVGVVGAATGHIQSAKNAAAAAGGATLISDRYQIAVQAINYERAAKAFLCMRDRLAAAEATSAKIATPLATSHPEVDARLGMTMRDKVLEVLDKLAAEQRKVKIAEPDIEKIKAALGMSADQGNINAFVRKMATPAIDELLKNIATCAAQF